jgi:hypothetical protein
MVPLAKIAIIPPQKLTTHLHILRFDYLSPKEVPSVDVLKHYAYSCD